MPNPSVRLSASNSGSSTSLAVTLTGTPVNGELLLFIVAWNESPTFSTPAVSGFTVLASITAADWNPLYIFGKIASGEGANPTYTCNFTGGTRDGASVGAVLVVQDANSSLPSNSASIHDTSASTTFSIPALTTAKAGSLDLVAVTQDGNSRNASSTYSSWGSSLVELLDLQAGGAPSGYADLGIAAVNRASAGVQAATSVTSAVSDKNVALRLEIEPVAAGTTWLGAAAIGGQGGVAATGQRSVLGAAGLAGSANVTGSGLRTVLPAAALSGAGALAASGTVASAFVLGAAAIAGQAAVTGAATVERSVAAAVAGVAGLTGAGTSVWLVAAESAGVGALVATGRAIQMLRPDADVANAGWVTELGAGAGLWDSLDEPIANDADYAALAGGYHVAFEVALSEAVPPDTGAVVLHVRARAA